MVKKGENTNDGHGHRQQNIEKTRATLSVAYRLAYKFDPVILTFDL
jgi:hypothetical protein